MPGSATVHVSKVDPWLAAIVVAAAIGSIATVAVIVRAKPEQSWPLFWSLCAAWAAIGLITWPMTYAVVGDALVVRSGVLKWKIPLHAIQEVTPSNNPNSAPAWSLDRLQIRHLKGESKEVLYVSPMDKDAFLRDMARADPNLLLQDGHIRRRTLEGL